MDGEGWDEVEELEDEAFVSLTFENVCSLITIVPFMRVERVFTRVCMFYFSTVMVIMFFLEAMTSPRAASSGIIARAL